MKWFNEHLNISYALIIIIATVIGVAVTFTGNVIAYIVGAIFSLILVLGGSAWILYKKGQSMLFLLLVLIFSLALFILALALPNKRTGQGEAKVIKENEYYNQRETGSK